MDSGQRALLKFWRQEGILTAKKPPRLLDSDGTSLGPRTWTHFFEAMDAYNLLSFHFKLDSVFVIIPVIRQSMPSD